MLMITILHSAVHCNLKVIVAKLGHKLVKSNIFLFIIKKGIKNVIISKAIKVM